MTSYTSVTAPVNSSPDWMPVPRRGTLDAVWCPHCDHPGVTYCYFTTSLDNGEVRAGLACSGCRRVVAYPEEWR